MERINPFSFYEFSKELHAFIAMNGPKAPREVFWPTWQARMAIKNLLDGKPIPIGISKPKAQALYDRLEALMDSHFQKPDEEGKKVLHFPDEGAPPIEHWTLEWIKTGISEFEAIFAEEMRETATYFVPRRGIYYTPALVDTAEQTFPKELLSHIPEKAKDDWRSAGRCLAFNLLSASGFHVARAVEACLESYYSFFSGKKETLHGWHEYIKALKKIAEKKPTPCPQEKTLTELDQMREDYRNPIVHPRVVLSEGDARMLFSNGESVIIAMAQELLEASKTGIQPTLDLKGSDDQPLLAAQ